MSDYYCPNCYADLEDQLGFDPCADSWTCEICGTLLTNPDSEYGDYDSWMYNGVRWYCDECGACLNYQSGFEDYYSEWMCTECCHINPINEENIYNSKDEYENSNITNDDDDSLIGSLLVTIGLIAAVKLGPKIANKVKSSRRERKAKAEAKRKEKDRIRNIRLTQIEAKRRERRRVINEMLAQQLAEQREQTFLRQEETRAWRQKHKKGIKLFVLILVLIILVFIGYLEYGIIKPIGYSSESLKGLNYTEVVQQLREVGFSNIETKEIPDLILERENEVNLVTEVNLKWGNDFSKSTVYPSKYLITVVYHSLKLYNPPMSSSSAIGMDYLKVKSKFENAGYINISSVVEYDLITGWIKSPGEVESVSINGNDFFTVSDEFRPDSEVVITYHALKKDKPKG